MFIQNVILVFFSLGVISCVFPWFLVAVGPLVLLFAALHSVSRVFIRELKRLHNVTMSTLQAYDRGLDFLNTSGWEPVTFRSSLKFDLTPVLSLNVLLFPGTKFC